jgi:hypothetical protein
MRRRNPRHAVTVVAATLAALGCLYGCGAGPFSTGAGRARHPNLDTHGQSTVTADQAAGPAPATAAAGRVLSALVLPAGSRLLAQRPAPAGLSAPAQVLSGARSVDVYRLYRLPLPMASAAAYLRLHLPAGLVADGAGQESVVDSAPGTLVVSATPRRLPAGIDAMELVDTIVRAGRGSSLVRADVQVIWYPARSAARENVSRSYRSVRVRMSGFGGPVVTTSSPSVIDAIETVLKGLPAVPAAIRSCPAVTVLYELTLEPVRSGQLPVVISTGGCEVDDVSVGGHAQPALWDRSNKLYLLARALLRQEGRIGWVSPPPLECHIPQAQTSRGSRPCRVKTRPVMQTPS